MNRIDRLHAILTHLQSKRIVKAEELAERFEVSIRTIYRDIRALEAGGVPVGAEAGIGYFLIDGYQLPPVMFTKQEAQALLIGGKLLEKQTDKGVNAAFQQALTKIRAILDTENKDDIEDMEKNILVNPFPGSEKGTDRDLQMEQIKSALLERKMLEFNYFSNYKSEFNNRSVEPVGLCYYSNNWHLIAFCLLRENYRDFRLDRISKLSVLNKRYKKHLRLSLQEYIDKLTSETELLTAKITVIKDMMRFIQNQKFQMGLIKEEEIGQRIQLTFATPNYDYFARWLLMMGGSVEIVEPKELKVIIKNLVVELSEKHN